MDYNDIIVNKNKKIIDNILDKQNIKNNKVNLEKIKANPPPKEK